MKVTVHYLAQLRRAAGRSQAEVELSASATFGDLLARLSLHGEELRRLLLDSSGALQPTILVFVNDEQAVQPMSTLLRDGDSITFLSPIAGG